jgi:hypothetical protein
MDRRLGRQGSYPRIFGQLLLLPLLLRSPLVAGPVDGSTNAARVRAATGHCDITEPAHRPPVAALLECAGTGVAAFWLSAMRLTEATEGDLCRSTPPFPRKPCAREPKGETRPPWAQYYPSKARESQSRDV